jgi:hypothetical protein
MPPTIRYMNEPLFSKVLGIFFSKSTFLISEHQRFLLDLYITISVKKPISFHLNNNGGAFTDLLLLYLW